MADSEAGDEGTNASNASLAGSRRRLASPLRDDVVMMSAARCYLTS